MGENNYFIISVIIFIIIFLSFPLSFFYHIYFSYRFHYHFFIIFLFIFPSFSYTLSFLYQFPVHVIHVFINFLDIIISLSICFFNMFLIIIIPAFIPSRSLSKFSSLYPSLLSMASASLHMKRFYSTVTLHYSTATIIPCVNSFFIENECESSHSVWQYGTITAHTHTKTFGKQQCLLLLSRKDNRP